MTITIRGLTDREEPDGQADAAAREVLLDLQSRTINNESIINQTRNKVTDKIKQPNKR